MKSVMKRKHCLYVIVFMISLVASLSVVRGQTIDELNTRVKQLEAENSDLQNKIKRLKKDMNVNAAEERNVIQLLQKENDSLSAVIENIRMVEKAQYENEAYAKSVIISNYIKDPFFLEYLLRCCDMDNDGVLTQWDAEHTYVIDISRDRTLWDLFGISHQITSIEGIERFVNLKRLVCSSNTIPRIDLSKNVLLETFIANGCGIQILELPQSSRLTHVECVNNLLYTIDLKNNPNLQSLNVSKNKMAVIDISECTKLKIFNCSGNALTSLDVSKNVQLQTLVCSNNKISKLSFVNNTSLDYINCSKNKLTDVDVRNGIVDFRYFDCSKNKDLYTVYFSEKCIFRYNNRHSKWYVRT